MCHWSHCERLKMQQQLRPPARSGSRCATGRGLHTSHTLGVRPYQGRSLQAHATSASHQEHHQEHGHDKHHLHTSRRGLLGALLAAPVAGHALFAGRAAADDFTQTQSGLRYLDIRPGEGTTPQPGDTVVVHWAGYTKGYQGKRIDNTSVRDEPFEFVLGSHQAIPAFEEAVSTMRVGGVRRVEVPGEVPGLSYPRDRSERFTNELLPSKEGKIYRYRYGPQPVELGGQRSLDFVLDNSTLNDLNRTLLFDIKVLAVRKPRSS